MLRKSVLFLILSIILLSSIQTQNIAQAAVASTTTPLNDVRMIGLDLQLEQNGTSFFAGVNSSTSAQVTNAQNNTIARFVASFVNENSTTSFLIQSFTVNLFNSTTQSAAANFISFQFATTGPAEVLVPSNGTYTAVFVGSLPFTLTNIQKVYSPIFLLQYQFQYSTTANTSNVFNLNSPYNYSVNSIEPPYSPPVFIIWAFWAITAAIVVQFIFAWYGNRKIKKQQETKK